MRTGKIALIACLVLLAGKARSEEKLTYELTGGPALTVRAAAEQQQWMVVGGKVVVAAVRNGQLTVEQWSWPPSPSPDPEPPPPPPVPKQWRVAILVESDSLDNMPEGQKTLVASLLLRDELKNKGHVLVGVFDPDAAETSETLRPWLDAAQGKSLPLILLAPRDGGQIRTYPLPADKAALWRLLESPTASSPAEAAGPTKTSCPNGQCNTTTTFIRRRR